jgi:ribosome-associated heat shock protein Hsp15
MRLDVALHELRLFKSRSQAQAAITAGSVLVNGEHAKPSRDIHPGDRVTLSGPGTRRTIEVLELPHRSLSRDAAKALIRDVEG